MKKRTANAALTTREPQTLAADPRGPAEPRSFSPTVVDGFRVLDFSDRPEVRIKCGDAQLELRADGRIVLRGKSLSVVTDGPIDLEGSTINLN